MRVSHGLAAASLFTLFTPAALAAPDFDFGADVAPTSGDVVIYVGEGGTLSGLAEAVNDRVDGRIEAAITSTEFGGEFGEGLVLHGMAPYDSIVLIGAGEGELSPRQMQDLGGHAATHADDEDGLAILVDALDTANDGAAWLATGYALGDYSFTKYKTVDEPTEDGAVRLIGANRAAAARYADDLAYLVEGVTLTRNFGNEPGNTLWPAVFVDTVETAFDGVDNITITVLDADDIRAANMGALMGVGQGSIHDPRLLVVNYSGGAADEAPIALVGKGITFDTGGISLKQNTGMWYMKSDLSGAAAVAGTVLAAAKRGEDINVVGVMPLAENMPSQDAIRPGDVLTTMSGKTIEIMSTDAEGRLLLADAVYYAQQEFEPRMLVNIATLTGSAARAMGDDYAAILTREIDLSLEMMEVGKAAGEDVWPLPLHPSHFDQIDSLIADIKNTGGSPGASIGAAVVGTFVDEELPWVHLDMAGVDWRDSATPTSPEGHAGWGVRFMDQLLRVESE